MFASLREQIDTVFRRDPAAYLATLEERLLKPALPPLKKTS